MAQAEAIRYDVVEKFGKVEMRDYPPHVSIEIKIKGECRSTVNTAYRVLGEYLAGKNDAEKKIEMIMPITQQGFEDVWKLAFSLPLEYKIDSLPKPLVSHVKLIDNPEKRYVATKLSGFASEKDVDSSNKRLMDYVFPNNLRVISQPITAFYNPPWALPFFRKNELMIEVRR